MQAKTSMIRRGVIHALPLVVPAIPFAFVFGIVVGASGLPGWLGWSSSPIIFGGAAQITMLTLIGEGASLAAAVTAALIVGTRHLLYSVTLAPRFQDQPAWFRWLGPYLLVDQVFALITLEDKLTGHRFRHYFLAAGFTFWSFWIVNTAIGIMLGPLVPTSWNLAFAAPVLFVGLLVTAADHWRKVVVGLVAALVTMLFAEIPNKGGLLLGACSGIVLGFLLEQFRQ